MHEDVEKNLEAFLELNKTRAVLFLFIYLLISIQYKKRGKPPPG